MLSQNSTTWEKGDQGRTSPILKEGEHSSKLAKLTSAFHPLRTFAGSLMFPQ
jgi:hypothetical protein